MNNKNGELGDLKGGPKHMWLTEHRNEIMEYMAKHGKGATMIRFHISQPGTLDSLIDRESGPEQKPTRFEVMKARAMAESSLEMTRDLQGQLRGLKESYQSFVESVGEQLALKFFLPLLRSVLKPPEGLEPEPDNRLSLDTMFGSKPELPAARDCDVVAEAEEILDPGESGDLEQELHAAWCNLHNLYVAACDRKDWQDALCMYLWMAELDCLREDENETPESFIEGAREWLAKARKPDELYICY